jgi:plastocyanin
LKKPTAVVVILCLVTAFVVACGGSSGSGSNDVHLGNTNFTQSSVTISKGSSLNLIDDVAVTHIISNGSWVNGTPMPATEPGAPTVSNVQFTSAGQSQTIGPFTTAGTFHLYCTVHQNMNLTVMVQ